MKFIETPEDIEAQLEALETQLKSASRGNKTMIEVSKTRTSPNQPVLVSREPSKVTISFEGVTSVVECG